MKLICLCVGADWIGSVFWLENDKSIFALRWHESHDRRLQLSCDAAGRELSSELREERWLAVNKSYFSIEMSLATLLDRFAFLVARGIFSHPPKSPTQLIVGNYTLLCISQILYTGHQNLFQRVKSDLQFQTTSSKLHKSFFTPYWQEILRWTARPQLAQVNLSLLHPVVKLHMKTYYRHPLK